MYVGIVSKILIFETNLLSGELGQVGNRNEQRS